MSMRPAHHTAPNDCDCCVTVVGCLARIRLPFCISCSDEHMCTMIKLVADGTHTPGEVQLQGHDIVRSHQHQHVPGVRLSSATD